MATFNLFSGTSAVKSEIARAMVTERFASVKNVNELFFPELRSRGNVVSPGQLYFVNSSRNKGQFHVISNRSTNAASTNGPATSVSVSHFSSFLFFLECFPFICMVCMNK